ncbi:MAG TPA: hypothetical protein VFH66_11110 [Mycobacteriales bacterium]|nr:hypothetical protein [Mycobacteriales bacterium]
MSARWRRMRGARTGHDPVQPDSAPPGPAVPARLPGTLEDLLDDMLELRLTLVADLSAAAAAVDADSDRVAGDIVDSDRRELAAFLRRSTARLNGAPSQGVGQTATAPAVVVPVPRSWRRRTLISLPAIPLVGALAMSAAAAAGLLPLPTQSHSHHMHVVAEPPVSSTFQQFATVVDGDPSASQVVAAADALHAQIAALIAEAPQNPSGVSEVARLLQLEQALLLRKQPPGSSLVLAQSRKLAAQLLTVAHAASPAAVPTATTASPHRSTSTKSTSTTSSPTPKSSTSKPAATTSPSPSPTSTSSGSPGHIPSIGG